ncbi:uncharacterized protein LOC105287661 isoform X2 [Ooceraea biroi]|nr:uncharacterized protein LOC105287661 isoform X2 [Ooceraea biroi]
MPVQKKALVTKRSGQDWGNFGLEKNGSLYLLAEEALFLLETNCLELIWNGVPCSIQQAYEILIDDTVCTLEEYRVYSQLTRYGYRIQRYIYEDFEKGSRSDESASAKRKIIVEPENGLRMCDNQLHSQQSTVQSNEPLIRLDKSCISLNTKNHQDTLLKEPVEQVVHDVVDHLLHSVDSQKNINIPVTFDTAESNAMEIDKDSEEKNRNSKPEIISDETLLCNIKILRDAACNSNSEAVKTSKWPGTRIQRNVKLLPKRSDKVSPPEISIIDSSSTSESTRCVEKRKTYMPDELLHKKSKLEVIDLSDDEVQELPHPVTRMDILNTLPNVALQVDIKEKISRRYIPHNIRPRKTVYEYNRASISRMQENDRRARQSCKDIRNNGRQNTSKFSSPVAISSQGNSLHRQRSHSPFCDSPRAFYQMHGTNVGLPYAYRFPYNCPDFYMQNRITQNVFHNLFVAFGNHGNVVQQSRSLTIQMNNFAIPFMGGYRARHFFAENQHFRPSPYQNFLWQQRFCQRRTTENAMTYSSGHSFARRQHSEASRNRSSSREAVNRPSFTTRHGATSWTELKRKWSEEKTITIDDEDYQSNNQNEDECDEVVKLINPLLGPKNTSSLAEIFSKLAIIKPAPERLVRRKKSKYKISYNVYSCTQHYRKANPGQPLYSLVVIRKENSFLQPVELNRLQQDAKGQIVLAYVSMSISYIQPGIITMPNVT